ncbi:MAG: hypothetical protein RL556_559 [Actinomycetota bacterium]|jgi:BirA family biotin operon repressor/biotin-[acetyl-CoA-carboxylase] ligase
MALFDLTRLHLPYGARFEWLESSASTNSELISKAQAEPAAWQHFSVLATDFQTAGRGRAGRTWQAPQGTSLAISVLLRPNLQAAANLNHLGWLPLLAGLAMSEAVNLALGEQVLGEAGKAKVKWPNDVLVNEKKITGVLSELLPDFSGVVLGAGLNVSLTTEQLPVPTATSLLIEKAELNFDSPQLFDQLLSSYLERLNFWYQRFANSNFDANKSGLRQAAIAACVSLGQEVRAILPGDTEILGSAITIDDTGRLVIEANSEVVTVAAGDIVHLRHN